MANSLIDDNDTKVSSFNMKVEQFHLLDLLAVRDRVSRSVFISRLIKAQSRQTHSAQKSIAERLYNMWLEEDSSDWSLFLTMARNWCIGNKIAGRYIKDIIKELKVLYEADDE